MQTSAEQVPSLYRVGPRYFKLVTSSNFWPFMPISALMLFVLLVMILLFSVLTSIPYAVSLPIAIFRSLSVSRSNQMRGLFVKHLVFSLNLMVVNTR